MWNVSERLYRKLPSIVCSTKGSTFCRKQKLFIKTLLKRKTSLLIENFLTTALSLLSINTHVLCPYINILDLFLGEGYLAALRVLSTSFPHVSSNVHVVAQWTAPESSPIWTRSSPKTGKFSAELLLNQPSWTPLLAHNKQWEHGAKGETRRAVCLTSPKPHARHKWLE